MEKGIRPNSTAAAILTLLGEGFDYVITGAVTPSRSLRYGSDTAWRIYTGRSSSSISKARKRLITSKFIKKHDDTYSVSTKGWIELFKCQAQNADLLPSNEMLMILFDIPESRRKERDTVRKLLKRSGCIALQRSVYVTPFDLVESLGKILAKMDLLGYVRTYKAEHVPLCSDRT